MRAHKLVGCCWAQYPYARLRVTNLSAWPLPAQAAINLPSAELIETADSHIHAAALVSLNSQYGLDKLLLKKSDDDEEVADD